MFKDKVVGRDRTATGIFELGKGYQGVIGVIHLYLISRVNALNRWLFNAMPPV